MLDHDIFLWTLIVAAIGVLIAAVGIVFALKTLRENAKVARAQSWTSIRALLSNYDDIHAYLRPGGKWAPEVWSDKAYPQDAHEWARVELYMGTYEYCETLISRGLLDKEDFDYSYKYRLANIVANPVIVEEKLWKRPQGWQKFIRLCELYNVPIPKPSTNA